MSQFTIIIDDENDSKPWQIVCEECGAEIEHDQTPDIHVFRVVGLQAMIADEGNAELIRQRLDALASGLNHRAIVIDADEITHEPPSLVERKVREHRDGCTRSRRRAG